MSRIARRGRAHARPTSARRPHRLGRRAALAAAGLTAAGAAAAAFLLVGSGSDLVPGGGVLGEVRQLTHCDGGAAPGRRLTHARSPALHAAESPLRQPIPPGAAVDPRSSEMIAPLVATAREKGFVISMKSWTIPVYVASEKTPRHDIPLVADWAPRGAVLENVPIPRRARPDPQDDGHLAVLDPLTGCEYDFWQARKDGNGRWVASWGRRLSLYGPGVDPGGSSARASGFSLTAGLIFPGELARGRIEHALVFSFPNTKLGAPVPPATSSDGWSKRPDAIPQGARIQLDPTLDLGTLKLTKAERAVARALQVYGMYLGDTGGAVGLFAAHPHSYKRKAYPPPVPEYIRLPGIPVERLRVLQLPEPRPVGAVSIGRPPAGPERLRVGVPPRD